MADVEHVPQAPPKMKLGELLIAQGILTQHRLEQALAEHKATGRRLGEVLMTRGWVSPMQLYEVLAEQMGLDTADLDAKAPMPVYARLIPESVARRLRSLPTGEHGHQLVVAMNDPLDIRAIDDLQTITGRQIRPVLANPDQLERAINSVWVEGESDIIHHKINDDEDEDDLADLYGGEDPFDDSAATVNVFDEDVVDLVDRLLRQAVAQKASDVHLEAEAEQLRVRLRVDGVLRDLPPIPAEGRRAIVSRIKVMAEMDITNRRSPQDGRINITVERGEKRDVGLRVVTIPTVHGESVVLRLLDSGSQSMPAFAELGMVPRSLALFQAAVTSPSGGVLVTGPTGSGKTTTLYSALAEVNKPETSIVTVEDPVEYRLNGIKQIQINVKAGMTFPRALKSILRADPDVVLVGEIRDAETAMLATEASLTGHLVLSTLHTNSAAATPIRMIEMGVEPFLVTAGITCVVAQRLARRLCHCARRTNPPSEEQLARSGWPASWSAESGEWHVPEGCSDCDGSGYSGRFGIHEVMPVSDATSQLILDRAPTAHIQRQAQAEGMLTLRQDALFKASLGHTSLEEVGRVTSAH